MKNEKSSFIILFAFLFSVAKGAAEERIYIEDLNPMLSFSPEMMPELPRITREDGESIMRAGALFTGAQVGSIRDIERLCTIADQLEFLEEKSIFVLEKDVPIVIKFPTLQNMYKIKKYLVTQVGERRIDSIASAKIIKDKLSILNTDLEGIYKRINELFAFAEQTKCLNSKCKKKDKIKNAEKEKMYKYIDYLIVDYFQNIVSNMSFVDAFNTRSMEKHYDSGTASQLLVFNRLYNDFYTSFFEMLKAFDYIKDEQEVFLLHPEGITSIHEKHQIKDRYLIACVKVYLDQTRQNLYHFFLIPSRGFYAYHYGEHCLLFNNGERVLSNGVLVNEVRHIDAIEKSLDFYCVYEVGEEVDGIAFGKKLIAEYQGEPGRNHGFLAFDYFGEDSFGQKFGYIKAISSIEVLLEELLYCESLAKKLHEVKNLTKQKALLLDDEDLKGIKTLVDTVDFQIYNALEYKLEKQLALSFVDQDAKKIGDEVSVSGESSKSAQDVALSAFDLLEKCEQRVEQAMNHYKKIAFEYYEKQIIAEQEKRKAAVASGAIYDKKKRTPQNSRNKQRDRSKQREKKEVTVLSKKEKEALSAQALAFLEENKVKASIKKRELDLLAKQMIKQLDPQNVVAISSNVDGSHEIFHAEGSESVTRAGHGNNPEYSSSVANEFLMNRARQIETSKRFFQLKKKLEEKN